MAIVPFPAPDSSRFNTSVRANELVAAAMEMRSPQKARARLDEALKVDPTCVYAMLAIGNLEEKPEAAERWFRKAVGAGEAQVKTLPADAPGGLWGFDAARPYLEARAELAQLLSMTDRVDEAIGHYRDLLKLNPTDNQGVRYPLLGLLLESKRLESAEALIESFATDDVCDWAYGRALLMFHKQAVVGNWDIASHDEDWLEAQLAKLMAGETIEFPAALKVAEPTLFKAMQANPWAALLLIPSPDIPETDDSDSFELGSPEEAAMFFQNQAPAWQLNPSVSVWFLSVMMPWMMDNGYEDELLERLSPPDDEEEEG